MSALLNLAAQLGVEPAVLAAVFAVEAGGKGLASDGRPIIRLEVHRLWKEVKGRVEAGLLPAEALSWVDAHFYAKPQDPPAAWEGHHWRPDSKGEWLKLHTTQQNEWAAFNKALQIDLESAVEATSWGLGQLIGPLAKAQWVLCGYKSAKAFMEAQWSEDNQRQDFVKFIAADNPKLLEALKAKNWLAFASIYNGPGKAAAYAADLEKAYVSARKKLMTITAP